MPQVLQSQQVPQVPQGQIVQQVPIVPPGGRWLTARQMPKATR